MASCVVSVTFEDCVDTLPLILNWWDGLCRWKITLLHQSLMATKACIRQSFHSAHRRTSLWKSRYHIPIIIVSLTKLTFRDFSCGFRRSVDCNIYHMVMLVSRSERRRWTNLQSWALQLTIAEGGWLSVSLMRWDLMHAKLEMVLPLDIRLQILLVQAAAWMTLILPEGWVEPRNDSLPCAVHQSVPGIILRNWVTNLLWIIVQVSWLKSIRDWQEEFVGNMTSREFVDTVTGDLLSSRVFVFTPKGEVMT